MDEQVAKCASYIDIGYFKHVINSTILYDVVSIVPSLFLKPDCMSLHINVIFVWINFFGTFWHIYTQHAIKQYSSSQHSVHCTWRDVLCAKLFEHCWLILFFSSKSCNVFYMFWFVYFIIIDLPVDTTVYIYMYRHLAMSLLNICHEIQWTFLPSTIASIDPCPLTCIITIGRIWLVSSPLVGSVLCLHHWSDLTCVITIGRICIVSSPLVGSDWIYGGCDCQYKSDDCWEYMPL